MKSKRVASKIIVSFANFVIGPTLKILRILISPRLIIIPSIILLARTEAFVLGTSAESIGNILTSQVNLQQQRLSPGLPSDSASDSEPHPIWQYFHERVQSSQASQSVLIVVESAANPFCRSNKSCEFSDFPEYLSDATKRKAQYKYHPIVKGSNTLSSEILFLCSQYEASKCLPSLFANTGKESSYYHSNDLHFYGRNILMPQLGFSRLISSEEILDKEAPWLAFTRCLIRQFCAPPDGVMFDIWLDLNNDSRKSSFSHILTLDLHPPYSGNSSQEAAYLQARDRHLFQVGAFVDDLVDLHHRSGTRLHLVVVPDHPPSIFPESHNNPNLGSGFWTIEI